MRAPALTIDELKYVLTALHSGRDAEFDSEMEYAVRFFGLDQNPKAIEQLGNGVGNMFWGVGIQEFLLPTYENVDCSRLRGEAAQLYVELRQFAARQHGVSIE